MRHVVALIAVGVLAASCTSVTHDDGRRVSARVERDTARSRVERSGAGESWTTVSAQLVNDSVLELRTGVAASCLFYHGAEATARQEGSRVIVDLSIRSDVGACAAIYVHPLKVTVSPLASRPRSVRLLQRASHDAGHVADLELPLP
jgi:hypothetical protein